MNFLLVTKTGSTQTSAPSSVVVVNYFSMQNFKRELKASTQKY